MKLHVGCGSVFLRGFTNVDLPWPNVFLASDRPDLVEKLIADESDYYGRHKDKTLDTLRSPIHQEMVCDRYGSFEFLPVPDGSVDELLSRQCFEHLSLTEAHAALERVKAALKPGGILRLDVPDHEESLRELARTGDAFYARHLMGPRTSERGYHMMSYTPKALIGLCSGHGLEFAGEEPNIHIYPAFCMRFRKSDGTLFHHQV